MSLTKFIFVNSRLEPMQSLLSHFRDNFLTCPNNKLKNCQDKKESISCADKKCFKNLEIDYNDPLLGQAIMSRISSGDVERYMKCQEYYY